MYIKYFLLSSRHTSKVVTFYKYNPNELLRTSGHPEVDAKQIIREPKAAHTNDG